MSTIHPGFSSNANAGSQRGDPAWEVAYLFPAQGRWSESDYLALDRNGRRMIELVDGQLKVLPMPTFFHHLLVEFLHTHLKAYVSERKLGSAFFAPVPVYFDAKNYREPDVGFVRPERLAGRDYPAGADLVMEVVSDDPESRKRDYDEKRRDYAAAGVPEYWIVDPQDQTVTVLALDSKDSPYRVHGTFTQGNIATSVLLPGFSIDVAELFAAAKRPQ